MQFLNSKKNNLYIDKYYYRACACEGAHLARGPPGKPDVRKGWGFGRNAERGVLCAPIGAEKVEIETAGSFSCAAADIRQEG